MKHKCDIKCKICGEQLSTGWCKTKIERWIKKIIVKRKHKHTRAEVLTYEIFGVYLPMRLDKEE